MTLKTALQRCLLLLAAAYIAGGHWGMLQVVAWSQMLAQYSAEKGLAKGIEDTFDGEHGCPMCRLIEEGQDKERREGPALPARTELTLKLFPAAGQPLIPGNTETIRERSACAFAAPPQLSAQWSVSPPSPPPRADAV